MTRKTGVLQSMGSQRVIHDLATEQQQCGYLRTFLVHFGLDIIILTEGNKIYN